MIRRYKTDPPGFNCRELEDKIVRWTETTIKPILYCLGLDEDARISNKLQNFFKNDINTVLCLDHYEHKISLWTWNYKTNLWEDRDWLKKKTEKKLQQQKRRALLERITIQIILFMNFFTFEIEIKYFHHLYKKPDKSTNVKVNCFTLLIEPDLF